MENRFHITITDKQNNRALIDEDIDGICGGLIKGNFTKSICMSKTTLKNTAKLIATTIHTTRHMIDKSQGLERDALIAAIEFYTLSEKKEIDLTNGDISIDPSELIKQFNKHKDDEGQ